jgi:Domain of unknown function (DUF4258)
VPGSYDDRFGHPPWISRHAMERMNTDGISPQQLANALANPAIPGTSAGTINFVAEGIIAVVDEEGMIVTVYWVD